MNSLKFTCLKPQSKKNKLKKAKGTTKRKEFCNRVDNFPAIILWLDWVCTVYMARKRNATEFNLENEEMHNIMKTNATFAIRKNL